MKYNYRDIYKNYDMSGTIETGGGTIKVHDIFNPLPDFMKRADCIFVDPPCSKGNLNTFYTKADIEEKKDSYYPFTKRLFDCIDEIHPKIVFIEVFKSNFKQFESELKKRFRYVRVYESTYYHRKTNRCWILQGSDTDIDYGLNGMDEWDAVGKICQVVEFECIGDLCMGQGLVGRSAYDNKRPFVGTELNHKRLAVLVDYITQKESEALEKGTTV